MNESERVTKEWYNTSGKKCFDFYRRSQENELVQLADVLKMLSSNAKVLDAGCGDGDVVEFLTNKGYDVTGFDLSDEMITQARKRAPKADLHVMSMYDMEFSQKFDLITSFFAILHLEKDKVPSVFERFHEILVPKGYVLLSVNQGDDEGYSDFFGKKVYFSSYTSKEIQQMYSNSFNTVWERNFTFTTPKGNPEHQMYFLLQAK